MGDCVGRRVPGREVLHGWLGRRVLRGQPGRGICLRDSLGWGSLRQRVLQGRPWWGGLHGGAGGGTGSWLRW